MNGEFILRLVAAGVLGGLIGFEREYRSKEAGVRTHFLVALGSTLFMIISQYGFEGVQAGRLDVARVAAQVVSGIGFIGAGVIIFQKNALRGLTTAAGLWVTAAIGLGCGAGMYLISAVATAMVLLVLEVMHYLLPQFGEKAITVTFTASSKEKLLEAIESIKKQRIHVYSYAVSIEQDSSGEPGYKAGVEIKVRSGDYVSVVNRLLDGLPGVTVHSIE